MNNNKLKVICWLILVFDCVTTKRISELKCEQAASLNSNSQSSQHSHMMEVVVYPDNETIFCPVTLISEDFVLVGSDCAFRIIFKANFTGAEVLVRQLEIYGEQHFDTKHFGVKRFIRPDFITIDVSLIQLNETVSYHNSTTVLRPACLWTSRPEPSDIYLIYRDATVNRTRSSPMCTIGDECTKSSRRELEGTPIKTIFCFENFSDIIFDDSFDDSLHDRLIMTKARNQTYIFGHVFGIAITSKTEVLATEISNIIEWIESIVWPNQTHLVIRGIRYYISE